MRKRKKKRKINPQKLFCFISFIFILTCCLWYGGRLIYFYHKSHQSTSNNSKTDSNNIALTLKNSPETIKSLRKEKEDYYFYQDVNNNYLIYSNILWRIVKINKDNSVLLITEKPITSLAYGTDEKDYKDSTIIKWLNKINNNNNSGILESKLHDISKYLVKTSVCTDNIDNIQKITCNQENNDYYLGLLSVEDYIKTGAKKSFILGKNISYLANQNENHEIWYIKEDGSLNESLGDNILGIRPTITLSSKTIIKSGSGTEKNPYKIEDKTDYFGGYVKLDQDMWRIYDFDETTVKLVLMDYLKDSNGEVKYKYSNNNYRHNDTVYGSLAYYMNHTYLNSLSYKNIILDGYYYNGYYGEDNNYDLKELFAGKIDTKVGLLSIGDVILNQQSDNFFTSTGISNNSNSIYIYHNTGTPSVQKISTPTYIVPCITIKKDNLKKGSGNLDDPYRTE